MDQLSTLYNLVVEHYKRIGDVDGDGYADLIVGAYGDDNGGNDTSGREERDDQSKYIEGKEEQQQQERRSSLLVQFLVQTSKMQLLHQVAT